MSIFLTPTTHTHAHTHKFTLFRNFPWMRDSDITVWYLPNYVWVPFFFGLISFFFFLKTLTFYRHEFWFKFLKATESFSSGKNCYLTHWWTWFIQNWLTDAMLEADLLRFPQQCSGIIDAMWNATVSAAQAHVLVHLHHRKYDLGLI